MFQAIVRDPTRFAPLERGGVFWVSAVYKHYVPPGRGNPAFFVQFRAVSFNFVDRAFSPN